MHPDNTLSEGYDEETTVIVRKVLMDIWQICGSYKDQMVLIGGLVPTLTMSNPEDPHVGTLDIDLALDAEALAEDDQYASLIELLIQNGYQQDTKDQKKFQLVKTVIDEQGQSVNIVVDFLRPLNAELDKNKPPIVENFISIRGSAVDLAIKYKEQHTIKAKDIDGYDNTIHLSVCSIPGFLAMKGHALGSRKKPKDAYDIYYCVKHYSDGIEVLAEECKAILHEQSAIDGYTFIREKFETVESFGPQNVALFMTNKTIGEENEEAEQVALDAFMRVNKLCSIIYN